MDKNTTSSLRSSLQLKWLLSACLLSPVICFAGGASLSVSPGSISNSYAGPLTLQIGGLTNGETVLVERFLDLNSNGAIDAGEPLVQSFKLTDGQIESVGGVRNGNVPGDNDLTVNGQITATLSFAYGPEFSRGSGQQLFRLSSPSGRFAPVQQALVVTQFAFGYQITGTVSSNGAPAPFALAGVLVQVGNDNEFIAGTMADASGHFSLNVSNGTYSVIGFLPGCVGNFATSPQVTVSSSNATVNVPLSAGTYTMSGNVTETTSGQPVPGVQCFMTSGNNDYAAIFSDSLGNVSAAVINGQWKIDPSDYSAMLIGCMRGQNKVSFSVSGANVSGVNLPFTKESALIYGTLMDDHSNPLPGVRLYGSDNSNMFQSTAYTDASGNYFLPADANTWNIGADTKSSGLPAGLLLQNVMVAVNTGQALHTNLVAVRATSYLVGRAVDSNGNPIGNGSMNANNTNYQNVNVQLAGDGSFAMPVWGGSWTLELETQTALSHNVVGPQISFNVTDGVSISNINYVAPISTRTISGSVKTGGNVGVGGLNVFAWASINGTNYNAGSQTDSGGNYSLPVVPGVWNVNLDDQGLAQRGYGPAFNQYADTSSTSQTVNFIVGPPSIGMLTFRQGMGVVGEFGNSATPSINFPVSFRNYRAIFMVFNDTNPPTTDMVLFTGPPGSGLTNTPADPNFGVSQVGTRVYYFSPAVRNPNTPFGGNWTVTYRGNPNNMIIPDPQSWSHVAVPVPTVTVNNDLLSRVSWSYKDMNGNPIGTPSFIRTNRVDLIDQNGNGVDVEIFPTASSFTWPVANQFNWSSIGTLRVDYYDDLTNQYFFAFTSSSPSLTGATTLSGGRYQFLLNGPPSQNYTIQFRTDLNSGNWSTLYVTNSGTSPITIVDPSANGPSRFYRVLVGP